ncbi:M50 family metallopeptidase [Calothrix sp. CCY 0018]|uniref:M50 family metallopeptidase n=1 Tax=Calothrix sp. CCY 0018 TaxID=3103864 RepID=UPI0039C6141D
MSQLWNIFNNSYSIENLISSNDRTGLVLLVGIAIVTGIMWQSPSGKIILYPLTLLSTWYHEMAHGLMAVLLGANFKKLEIFANGNGLARYEYRGSLFLRQIGNVLVSAAGPMGPPIIGAGFILASRSWQTSQQVLIILGSFMLISVLIWVRTGIGILLISLLGLVILGIGLEASPEIKVFSIQFLGVQACISTFRDFDYVFRYYNGNSDTAQIAKVLILPHWFWGILITVASLFLLIQSLRIAYFSN